MGLKGSTASETITMGGKTSNSKYIAHGVIKTQEPLGRKTYGI
jgi:hypothetical protein